MRLIKGVYQGGCGRDHKSSKRLASNHSQLLGTRPELEIHLQVRKQPRKESLPSKLKPLSPREVSSSTKA